jgi:hypothetical protein
MPLGNRKGGRYVFKEESAILQAAAALAAAQHQTNASSARSGTRYTDSSVDVLINILREVENKKLIPAGLVPRA